MSKQSVIIGIIIIVLLGVGGYAMINKKPASQQSPAIETTQTSNSQSAVATITFSESGFSPASTTVKSGDVVAVKNDSSVDMEFDSDPHPVHTDDTELNIGLVSAGQTKTFTVVKTGAYGVHNHLNPTVRAKLTIQ